MAEQVLNGDRVLGLQERVRRLAVGVLARNRHLKVCKRWKIFRDGIGQCQLTFLGEHHRGDRRERFRHRVEPEDRVLRHRRVRHRVALAERLEVHDLALARDQHHGAGEPSVRDLHLHCLAHALETLRGQPNLLRLRDRQWLRIDEADGHECRDEHEECGESFHGAPPSAEIGKRSVDRTRCERAHGVKRDQRADQRARRSSRAS